ncbi:MAG: hypothetical protein J5547_02875, partial [Clostridia bacterium]|nr:hypothetical protein [Clostridia bacterium]
MLGFKVGAAHIYHNGYRVFAAAFDDGIIIARQFVAVFVGRDLGARDSSVGGGRLVVFAAAFLKEEEQRESYEDEYYYGDDIEIWEYDSTLYQGEFNFLSWSSIPFTVMPASDVLIYGQEGASYSLITM